MNTILQLFLAASALLFSAFVIRLLMKNKIGERNSAIWLGGVLVLSLLSINPRWFDHAARLLGIHYPPALLYFVSSMILLSFSLYQTVQITKLNAKITDISQYIALNMKEEEIKNGLSEADSRVK